MVNLLLVLTLCAKTALVTMVYPTGIPMYCDSFIPAAAQVVYYVIEHMRDMNNALQESATSDNQSLKTPLRIYEETNIKDVSGMKPLARTHKQLLNLHNALIREAKMQGLAKYQGFSEDVLSVLRKTSKNTSQEQLKTVLEEALSRGHIQRADTKEAAASVIDDLENPGSELCKTMANLKALQYV